MVVYPIRVPWKGYRGSKPKLQQKMVERNRLATKLEKYLNDRIAERDEPIQQFLYYQIADDLNLSIETVREILYGVDGGHNGLTVSKPGAGVTAESWA